MSDAPDGELPGVHERAVAWYRRRAPRGRGGLALALVLTLSGAVVSAVGLVRIDAANPHLRHSPAHLVGVDAEPTPDERARVGEIPREQRWAWFAVGFALLLTGAVGAIAQLRRELVREEYLLLHTEGLALLRDGQAVEVAWDRVEAVVYDADERAVEVRMRGYEKGLLLRDRFVGVDGPMLARRMEEIRRKASFGLLPEQRAPGRDRSGGQNT